MQFDNPYGTLRSRTILVNDLSDFRLPYETSSQLNREYYEWKFFHLQNRPNHRHQIRLGKDNPFFGGGGYG